MYLSLAIAYDFPGIQVITNIYFMYLCSFTYVLFVKKPHDIGSLIMPLKSTVLT